MNEDLKGWKQMILRTFPQGLKSFDQALIAIKPEVMVMTIHVSNRKVGLLIELI